MDVFSLGNTQSSGTNSAKDAEEEEQGSRKTLEEAAELMVKGSAAMKANGYAEAAECFSQAVEIKAAHFGELAPECANAYYKYGCALLYIAQEEVDPLGFVPKKNSASIQPCEKDGSLSKGECGATSVIANGEQDKDLNYSVDEPNNGAIEENDVNDDAECNDEDESDLDLAWKMLLLASAIVKKNPGDTMEKVDVLSALGEVAVERDDLVTSLRDYSNALSMLHRLVESDNRQIAELNFRICLVLELDSKIKEAVVYCQNAISVCKARVQRLNDEVKASTVVANEGKEAEIKTINGLLVELEKKLDDLLQLDLNPNPVMPGLLKMLAAKAEGNASSNAALESARCLGQTKLIKPFVLQETSIGGTSTNAAQSPLNDEGNGSRAVVPPSCPSGSIPRDPSAAVEYAVLLKDLEAYRRHSAAELHQEMVLETYHSVVRSTVFWEKFTQLQGKLEKLEDKKRQMLDVKRQMRAEKKVLKKEKRRLTKKVEDLTHTFEQFLLAKHREEWLTKSINEWQHALLGDLGNYLTELGAQDETIKAKFTEIKQAHGQWTEPPASKMPELDGKRKIEELLVEQGCSKRARVESPSKSMTDKSPPQTRDEQMIDANADAV